MSYFGLIIVVPFGALAAWSIFAIARWLRQGGYGRAWWKRFVILATVGVVVGIWFAGFTKYKMANFQLEGFPIPLSIVSPTKSEPSGPNTVMPGPIRFGAMVTDFLSGVALCLAPIPVALFFKENRSQTPWARRDANPPS